MSWKNFQVWVLTKKTISYHLRDLIKKSFFVKFEIFNICSMDEFLQGWVLTYENSKNWCKKTFLNVCQYHFDEILTLKNSMMFTLVKKNIWSVKFWNFIKKILMIWYGCKMLSDWLKWSNLSPKLFCDVTMTYFWWTNIFSEISQKPYLPCLGFFEQNIPGMSSYDPRSSSIEKYEFWRIFWIPILWSYLR